VKRIQLRQEEETTASLSEPTSTRDPSEHQPRTRQRRSDEEPSYRLTWRRGPRRARHDQSWERLSRRASVVHETATREAGVTTDPCGAATLVVESGGERAHLWRNWQGHNYPFVCALLYELGKPNPFRFAAPRQHVSSPATRVRRVSRRERSVRS
jgi:hypothetical protein